MARSVIRGLALAVILSALDASDAAGAPLSSDQQPLTAGVGFAHLPLTQFLHYDLGYTVDVNVGTPPQGLTLKIEIASAETYVRDAVLSEKKGCKADRFFDSRASSSFRANNTREETDFANGFISASGVAAEDVFRFGPIDIHGQRFIDADDESFNGVSYDNYCGMDGVLGFSNSTTSSTAGVSGQLSRLADEGSLDASLFALRLRDPAQLSLGAVNPDLFRGDIIHLHSSPLDDPNDSIIESQWRTHIDYIMAGSEPALHYVFGQTVIFTTASAFMYFPDLIFEDLIMNSLGFEDMPFLPPSVDCAQRNVLPDLTFNFAGHNFTITPYDYTLRFVIPNGPTRCVTAILPIGMPNNDHAEIILGSAFLQAFYSVFDFDSQTIGLAALS